MLVNKSANRIRPEIPALQRARFEQHMQELFLQFLSHPVREWKLKTLLPAVEQLWRESQPFRQFFQNVFAYAVTELPFDG